LSLIAAKMLWRYSLGRQTSPVSFARPHRATLQERATESHSAGDGKVAVLQGYQAGSLYCSTTTP
jgi:hypothetical protein